jgi:hypothetical protein
VDDRRFDVLTRALGTVTSRRQALKALAAASLAGLFSRSARDVVAASGTAPQSSRRLTSITPAHDAFRRTWERTDRPVAEGRVARTWMWGPEPFTEGVFEPYAEAPQGQRLVQYYDKSRMEITHPDAVDDGLFYVTNGLLVVELMTGQLQVGDATFEPHAPSQANVAGDADDPDGPTYATFASLRALPARADGALITQRVARDGSVGDDPSLAAHGVTCGHRLTVEGIDHQIATPFWDFMTSTGLVIENGADVTAQLFQNPFYATGYPLTEAYWADVRVGGTSRLVLSQCFERRCLTYTPGNPEGFVVEAGNVGQHYHAWRASNSSVATLAPAPSEVEAQLLAAAQANSDFQILAAYLSGLGFYPTGQEAYQRVEPGAATHSALVVTYV